MLAYVCMIGRLLGTPRRTRVDGAHADSAGNASASSTPTEMTTDRDGPAQHVPDHPRPAARTTARARRRAMIGHSPTRPGRRDSPSRAGNTVTDPMTATATTSIVPRPSEVKTALPATNIPAIAVITVSPDMRTARPLSPPREPAPWRCRRPAALFELAAKVEHRVVDADGESRAARPLDLALRDGDRGGSTARADRGRPMTAVKPEQERNARGDQRAEREEQDHQRDRAATCTRRG